MNKAQINYREKDGLWYFGYSRIQLGFKIDYDKRLFNSVYHLTMEMAITDWEKNDENLSVTFKDRLRSTAILTDEASGFSDPEFWGEFNVIEAIANKSLGKGQWSEYDPSIVETANYLIEDEQNIYGLLSINESSDLLHTFFMELLEKNIKVISINFESSAVKTINQIDNSFIKSIDKNSYIFAREYDHINSY